MAEVHFSSAPFSFLDDPSVPKFDAPEYFTVMDANCGLCARGAAWIARNDAAEKFRIVPVHMSGAIFPVVLGDAFHELPRPLQELHRGERSSVWDGKASTRGAQNLAGRIVAALFRLPVGDHRTNARVSIEVTRKGETWTRSFSGKQFRSHLSLGAGREAGLVCERFVIITVAMAIRWKDGKLRFVPRRWRIRPVPLPGTLRKQETRAS